MNKLSEVVAAPVDAAESGIRVKLDVAYPEFSLQLDVTLPGRGVTALFGHSGSGKTTGLRAMAGLEPAARGYFAVNGEVWQDDAQKIFLPTHRRPLGYVFQEASLFPHLSVRRNLEYGLKRTRAAAAPEWSRMLDLLGIEHLLERKPEKLSGGERQRVAIARALLTKPRLLFLDEPLAALDLQRKSEILPYLERLRDELDLPMIYVSHAPDEVARLADHLVLLDQGKVVASGPLRETLARLDLPKVFTDDAGVVVDTLVSAHEEADHLTRLRFPGGDIWVSQRPEPLGRQLRCRINARDVSLTLHSERDSSILNILPALVLDIAATDTPAHVLVRLDAGGVPLLARITKRSCGQLQLSPGKPVWAQIKAVALLD